MSIIDIQDNLFDIQYNDNDKNHYRESISFISNNKKINDDANGNNILKKQTTPINEVPNFQDFSKKANCYIL
jgi:hypothetical protein